MSDFLDSGGVSVLWNKMKEMSGDGGTPALQSLEITTPPDKVSYGPGEVFDPTGMVVTVEYAGGFVRTTRSYTIAPDGPLEIGVEKVTISYTENGVTVTAEQPIAVTYNIYGVTWDGTSTTKWTRTDRSALFTDPVPYVAGASSYSSPFDNLMPWAGMVKEERTGGTMVAIPKFWYKLEQNTPGTPRYGMTIKIADGPAEGFAPSPAHMDRGDGKGERDVVYVGRYHCASDCKSKTGQLPKVNTSCSAFRTEIHKLGENIWQIDFATRFTIWLLYLVEFAGWNSQKTIGAGASESTSANNAVFHMGKSDGMPYHTGTTSSTHTAYGVCQYRNIEGLWDNCYDWADGCYNSSTGFYIILNPNNFSDSSGGTAIGTPSTGYPTEFTVSNAPGFPMFFPTKKGGSSSTYSCCEWNYYSTNANLFIGARFSQTSGRGFFFVSSYSGGSHDIGSRIMELP